MRDLHSGKGIQNLYPISVDNVSDKDLLIETGNSAILQTGKYKHCL